MPRRSVTPVANLSGNWVDITDDMVNAVVVVIGSEEDEKEVKKDE